MQDENDPLERWRAWAEERTKLLLRREIAGTLTAEERAELDQLVPVDYDALERWRESWATELKIEDFTGRRR